MDWRPAHWVAALALASAAHALLIQQVLPADIGRAGPGSDVALDLRIGLSDPLAAAAAPAALPRQPATPRDAVVPPPTTVSRPTAAPAEPNQPAAPAVPATAAGGDDAVADYYARLQAWLNAHKRYPTEARHRGLEGVAELEFELGRNGQVRWARVARSSGHRMLDTAAERLMAQASPMPRPPEHLSDAELRLRVPVQYSLY